MSCYHDHVHGSNKLVVIAHLEKLMEDGKFLQPMGLTAIALHDELSEEQHKAVEKGQ